MTEILEERFVVYIDILGFARMVGEASKDPLIARKVDSALAKIQQLQLPAVVKQDRDLLAYRCHMFSDCAYLSVGCSQYEVTRLLVALSDLTVDLMSIGVWIRGGVAVGLVSNRAETPWGPAIVEAAVIESTRAINPRIALSKSACEFLNSNGMLKDNKLFVRDSDGVWSIEPFAWALKQHFGRAPFLTSEIGTKIKYELEKAYDETTDYPEAFRKIDWLINQWDRGVKQKDSVPNFDVRTKFAAERDKIDVFDKTFKTWMDGLPYIKP